MKLRYFLLIMLISLPLLAQSGDVTIIGDSLKGKTVKGQKLREVIGNVIITQEDVRITCDTAIQYFADDIIELIGNVIVTRDTLTMKTKKGFYLNKQKVAYSDSAVYMNDGKIDLYADRGYYYSNQKLASFSGNVKVIDSVSTLTSETLDMYQEDDKTVATGNVVAKDTSGIIYADKLTDDKKNNVTIAFGNVIIDSPKDNVVIIGTKLIDDKAEGYTRIEGDPMLSQTDTTSSGKIDTLVISAGLMEAYDDSLQQLVTTDSVQIIRGDFSSANNKSILYRTNSTIKTHKQEEDKNPPVMWFENSQLVGDSINIFIEQNLLRRIDINLNAFILTTNENYPIRFDQISGDSVKMHFADSKLAFTEVFGNVLSIYYMYDEGEKNGLLKSSSKDMKVYFDSSKVVDVKMYGEPLSEYHPENLVETNERDFTLPSFVVYDKKPNKQKLLDRFYQRSKRPVNK